MSTRSQIKIVSNDGDELWFYRHSDGYPSGNLPTLRKFIKLIKDGLIRNNVEQSAGWLIIEGAKEYAYNLLSSKIDWKLQDEESKKILLSEVAPVRTLMGWKVGAYEPCCCRKLHPDVKWLYEINVNTLAIKIINVGGKTLDDQPDLSPDEIEKLF